MSRLTPPTPPPDPSGQITYADGLTPCPWCQTRPPAGDPWSSVHIGTVIWERACLQCAIDNDDGLQPRRAEEDT